jgi:hypothetical protein
MSSTPINAPATTRELLDKIRQLTPRVNSSKNSTDSLSLPSATYSPNLSGSLTMTSPPFAWSLGSSLPQVDDIRQRISIDDNYKFKLSADGLDMGVFDVAEPKSTNGITAGIGNNDVDPAINRVADASVFSFKMFFKYLTSMLDNLSLESLRRIKTVVDAQIARLDTPKTTSLLPDETEPSAASSAKFDDTEHTTNISRLFGG